MKSNNSQQLFGAASLIGAAMLYGMTGIISRFVGFELPIFYQNWTRCVVPVVFLIFTYRAWTKVYAKDFWWILLRAVTGIAAFLLFFFAVNELPVSLTYFIFYGGAVIFGFIIGSLLFKEQLTTIRLISLLLAFVGMGLIYGIGVSAAGIWNVFLAFLSGAFFSLWNAISKYLTRYPPTQLTFLDNALCVAIYIPLSLFAGEAWVFAVTPVQLASLSLGFSFLATGLFIIYGFRRIDVQVGSLILLSEIIFAIIYSFIFYKEVPSTLAVLGGICIVVAMSLPEISWDKIFKKHYANRRKDNK